MKLFINNFHIVGAKHGIHINNPSPDWVLSLKNSSFSDIADCAIKVEHSQLREELRVPGSVSDEDLSEAIQIARNDRSVGAFNAISKLNTIAQLGDRAISWARDISEWVWSQLQ